MTGNGHPAWLGWMLVLSVAAPHGYQEPAIILNQPNNIPNLHGGQSFLEQNARHVPVVIRHHVTRRAGVGCLVGFGFASWRLFTLNVFGTYACPVRRPQRLSSTRLRNKFSKPFRVLGGRSFGSKAGCEDK
jgi:hypothetical protein